MEPWLRCSNRTVAKAISEPALKANIEQAMHLLGSATGAVRASVKSLDQLTDIPPLSEAVRELNPPSRLANPVSIVVDEEGEPWPVRNRRRFFLVRIAQEAVNNACKHARATEVHIRLRWSRFRIELQVEDDGQGFDLQAAEANEGYGLGAMRRMADAGRIRLNIESRPGSGTRISLEASRYGL